MGKLITAKIDVTKINKDLLFKGEKGTYLDLTIWVNDEPDKYGNDISIEQKTDKGQTKIYLGNGKTYHKKDVQKPDNNEGVSQKGKITTGSKSDINDLPGANNESGDLPFN
jgi:hypothetical protein